MPSRATQSILLVALPWLASSLAFVGFLTFGVLHPHMIHRDGPGFYCSIVSGRTAPAISAGISGLVMLPAIAMKFYLGLIMYRNWTLLSTHAIHIGNAIRVMIIITAGALVLTVLIIYLVSDPSGSQSDFVLAGIPILAILVFGTSKDIRVWLFFESDSVVKDEGPSTTERQNAGPE
ncbi:hypothetical protein HGRIS_014411 [Hohenbuehelia grisea]|uniref:Uncharacterized protein n=1 Tax=Hohenbuehelia grisea TaxID=104357 RepID=A0ABR3JUS2_9AGAR